MKCRAHPGLSRLALAAVTLLHTGSIAQGQVVITGKPAQVPGQPDYSSKPLTVRDTSGSRPYTWHDGRRTRTVHLLPNLALRKGHAAAPPEQEEEVLETRGDSQIVRRGTTASTGSGEPVFLSRPGTLLTLPGGVLLVFHKHLGPGAIGAFLAEKQIAPERLSPIGITNGFLLATEPGLPSLETANALAGEEGVLLASPNWSFPIEGRLH